MSENPNPAPPPPELKKSGANGCLMTVVVTIVIGIAVVLGGGYYAMMHSSLPLESFAAMVNSSGKAEIKGLDGSLSSGFSADEFRIFQTGSNDSYFTGVSFKYNGMRDIAAYNRFIVEEFRITKAFISLPAFKQGKSRGRADGEPAFDAGGLDQALSQEDRGDIGVIEIKSVRIDEFVIENSAGELKTGSLLMSDFKAAPSGVSLGDLKLTGDFIEMTLENLPETNQYRQIVRGAIKAALDESVRRDIGFTVEFGGVGNAARARYSAFDGRFKVTPSPDGQATATIAGLTLTDYLDPEVADLPADLSLVMTSAKDGKRTEVSGGGFRLGKTRFEVGPQALVEGDAEANKMTAIAEVGGKEVILRIADAKKERHFQYEFASEGFAAGDLPARVLFEKSPADLSAEQKSALATFVSRHMKSAGETEGVVDPAPVPVPAPAEK